MKTLSLNGEWSLVGKRQDLPDDPPISLTATVPGCVQLDLSRSGYLPANLFMGENTVEAEKYDFHEWWY